MNTQSLSPEEKANVIFNQVLTIQKQRPYNAMITVCNDHGSLSVMVWHTSDLNNCIYTGGGYIYGDLSVIRSGDLDAVINKLEAFIE